MVCFECQKCNETVKKPKLAKHLLSCGSYYVSCIDCRKVFAWDEWETHTSCMSEAQKYQGKLYQPKESSNKGQQKQDAWTENVEQIIEDPTSKVSAQTKALLRKLLGFSNIPRKQKPFANFVKNSLKIWDDSKINDIWDAISAANVPKAQAKAAPPSAPASEEAKKTPEEPAQETQAEALVKWKGLKRALDEELASAGGEMPWKRVRDNLVARCRSDGAGEGVETDALGIFMLASIPEAYLSKEDALVRLPAKA